ncbi:MAG: hypothetical protein HQK99_15780 [Nitrospirae bacterium]|nr:hypothetical protein [Nitrospirota bacterium]
MTGKIIVVEQLAEKCENKFYSISLKDSYLKKKYKVRLFFLDSDREFYSVPKIPKRWHYGFNDGLSTGLIAAAYTGKEAVDIEYFKDFLTFAVTEYRPEKEIYFKMKLICHKPDGTPEIIVLKTEDFVLKEIHKCLKEY